MFDAAVEAVTHTDAAVGVISSACKEAGYVLVITADHGNAEQMINLDTGAPHTAHTTNAVPLIVTGGFKLLQDVKEDEDEPALCDVAPTVLDIMGLEKPEGELSPLSPPGPQTKKIARVPDRFFPRVDMTGRSLLAKTTTT